MTMPAVVIATWENGLCHVEGGTIEHEFAGQSVRGLAHDGRGGVLAIVGAHSLRRRSAAGEWSEIADSSATLSCCVAIGDGIVAGTDDARLVRIDSDGTPTWLAGFDAIDGRETWYAGRAVIDGTVVGPPLGVRSLSAAGDVLYAGVHVGGVPRSADAGQTWRPTIDIEHDVHEVCVHPTRPEIVAAAAAVGLCLSRDGGTTWAVERRGLHAPHCSGVAFGRNDVFVSASVDPFSAQGALYRRPIDDDGPLQLVGDDLPAWLDGVVDTRCVATRDAMVAVIDRSGRLYRSHDDGASWTSSIDERFSMPSGLLIC